MDKVANSIEKKDKKTTILIVDDNPIDLKLAITVLESYNFKVLVSVDGENCLKQAIESSPDIILLDVLMPIIDGFEICKRLKAIPETRDIPVIFMTALSDIEDKITGFELGAVDYVTKPIIIDEVLARVKVHIQLRQLTEKLKNKNVLLLEEITQRKAAEAKLKETLRQLKTAQKQIIAKEKLAYLGTLTSGIAHELCNPLNFIQNFAQLSTDLVEELMEELALESNKMEPEKFEEFQEIINDIKQNSDSIYQHGKRAEKIIKGMIRHTQIDHNSLQLSDIHNMLNESLHLSCQKLWEKENVPMTIQINYDESINKIKLSFSDIFQAFMNIIDNSCYALKTKLEQQETANQDFNPTLSVQTYNLGEKVAIHINDNGIGISSKVKDKIFDPFFTTKSPGEGVGLGLSLVHQIIVEQHHGSIKVETKAGKYAEFIIEIPMTDSRNFLPEQD
ncbi:MAG: response regulator [Okeania sp. SIO2C9]|uniref:hybrid sensor histidine kinase/response regulator n=1 Tax=Okeania sp. SIO2C9 TaxID=2607791 RepID=UPI0013BFECD1|nr:response regulator [Okeania sp. SIO2C9]NEQ74266.1 response regulator [Okeania sp. SIO2C9]